MIITYENLSRLESKNIIFVIGTFDILHHGHLYFLNKAKMINPKYKLLVGIISDKIVNNIKGKNRPIIPERHRIEMLNNLKCVNYTFVAPELPTGNVVKDILRIVKPKYSVITKSSWQNRQKPYSPKDARLVIIEEEVSNISTTNIINKIKSVDKKRKVTKWKKL